MQGNTQVIDALNRALTIELTAINQYFCQAKMCKNWGYTRLAKKHYEDLGLFSTQVGDQGGQCEGGGARWTCRLDILQHDTVRDARTYDMAVDGKGCWVARQTGTDVGVTGHPVQPSHPEVLRGCLPH